MEQTSCWCAATDLASFKPIRPHLVFCSTVSFLLWRLKVWCILVIFQKVQEERELIYTTFLLRRFIILLALESTLNIQTYLNPAHKLHREISDVQVFLNLYSGILAVLVIWNVYLNMGVEIKETDLRVLIQWFNKLQTFSRISWQCSD